MRLKTEKEILSRIQRPPGLPSSFVALETALGKDETIDFEDILNGEWMTKKLYKNTTAICGIVLAVVVAIRCFLHLIKIYGVC